MAYMSYCRYDGTRSELQICMDDVRDHVNEEAEYKVSDREIKMFRRMVEDFVEFLTDLEIIDEHGYVDQDALDSVCKSMERGYKDDE